MGAHMLKLIKDPVIGNTVLSEIETINLEMPVINRLYHKMQNGLTYWAFPSDTNSRFKNSISVMYLFGSMYCRSTVNSLLEEIGLFLRQTWRTDIPTGDR
jgi:HD superfamily phosphohydrolase